MSPNTQQELASLSSTPLHGVTLALDKTTNNTNTPFTLDVSFNPVTPLSKPKTAWTLTDKGDEK